jgi:NodT family efflux transporter outer membrane factor (OMF) lipoprotein
MNESATQRRSAARAAALFFATMLSVALAACVSRGDWKAAHTLAPQELSAARSLATAHVDMAAWPTDDWWRGYGDPQLDSLIDEAIAGSPSLEIAQARLHAAQAQATSAHAARLPSAALNAEATRQRYPENGLYPPPFAGNAFTDGRLALDFSYDIDFWGRNRALLDSARAGVQAAEADKAAARLALAVAVARAYIQLDLSYNLLDVAQSNLEQQTSILDLTRQRVSAGLENGARVKQQDSNLALTNAGVEAAQANIKLARNQIAALVGAGPDRGLDLKRPALTAPQGLALPSALPVDLLARRPDIAAARWRVEAASRGIAASEAAFYPNVNLVAFAGLQSIGLSKLFDASDAIVGGGPAIHLPVFNRGELRQELQANQAQYDVAVGEYNQTLIDSVHEVADVVANWGSLEKETVQQQIALESAQRSFDLTRDRYSAGLDNYLTVLSSQNQVLMTQALRAELQARRLSFSTDLIRALGGGYSSLRPDGRTANGVEATPSM